MIINLAFILTTEIHNHLRAENIPYIKTWRARQNWLGLTPVFIIAAFKAIIYGPKRKPTYKVTRKNHQHAFYWIETFPQYFLFGLLTISITLKLITGRLTDVTDIVLIYWGLFLMYGYNRVIRNSWFGKDLKNLKQKFISLFRSNSKNNSLPLETN